MNPIDILKTEHRAIENALEILDRIAGEIGTAAGAADDAAGLIDFLKTFADACHHGKEEDLLFPVLEEIGVSKKGGPIGVMLAEHDQGRAHIAGMHQVLADLAGGRADAPDRFRQHAASYVALLRAHIQKEEKVLFEIAARGLSKVRLSHLGDAFNDFERRRMGDGTHERYHRLLDRLGARYAAAA